MFSITNLMSKANSFLNTAYSISSRVDRFLRKAPPVLLSNIQLELVSEISINYSNDVPVIPVDDGSQISDNISNSPLTLSFKVQIVGVNHKEIFEKILEMRKRRELVDLYLIKLYKNVAITSIEHAIHSLHYTEFTISFVQIQIAHISMIPAPSKKAKPAVSKKVKIKNNSNSTGKKSWEGELASESIKLPGG